MKSFDSQEEFDEWVESIAETNKGGEDPWTLAACGVTSIEVLDEDTVTLTSAAMHGKTRVDPTEVLKWTLSEVNNPMRLPGHYRDAAVELLRDEIKQAEVELGYREEL